MTDLAELVVRIKADASELERQMRSATNTVQSSASSMRGSLDALKQQFQELAPVLSVAALVEFGKSAFESADHINDLALRIGFAGSTLSALSVPLKQSGSSLDEFSGNINRMNNLIGEAAKGVNQDAIKAFDALGLSVKKLAALSPEQQFYAIAQALGQIDNQSQQTNAGMAIFGRAFVTLLPLIKESHGKLKEFTDQAKASGDALTDDQLKRIDDLGDKWVAALEKMKRELLEVTPLITALAQVPDYLRAIFIELPQQAGRDIGYKLSGKNPRVSFERPNVPTDEELAASLRRQLGGTANDNPARGSNADLLRPKDSALTEYINNLKSETKAIGENQRALFIDRAEIEAASKAKEDFANHLRSTKDLTVEEKANIDDLAGSFYDLKKAQEESAQAAKRMEDAFASSIEEIITDFHSLKSAVTSVMQSIAREIIHSQVSQPLSSGLANIAGGLLGRLLGGGGGGSSDIVYQGFGPNATGLYQGFADGGSPPVGVPSIVGERGPELFVPNSAGTVVPNHKLGGSVSVTNVFHLSPGLTETVAAAIQNAAPVIRDSAISGTLEAIQRGGAAAKVVGRKN